MDVFHVVVPHCLQQLVLPFNGIPFDMPHHIRPSSNMSHCNHEVFELVPFQNRNFRNQITNHNIISHLYALTTIPRISARSLETTTSQMAKKLASLQRTSRRHRHHRHIAFMLILSRMDDDDGEILKKKHRKTGSFSMCFLHAWQYEKSKKAILLQRAFETHKKKWHKVYCLKHITNEVQQKQKKQNNTKNSTKRYPKGQAPFNSSRVPAAMHLMFCRLFWVTSSRRGHWGLNVASQRLLWILEGQSVNGVSSIPLQQMYYNVLYMMTIWLHHPPVLLPSTFISFPNLVDVFM